MKPPLLIAFYSSAQGSGKTEAARHLISAYGFMPVKFATVLKTMAGSFFGALGYDQNAIHAMLEGDLKGANIPEIGCTPRHIMQTLGTEWGRNSIREDLWVHIAEIQAQRFREMGRPVVIDDMRFPNELAMVRSIGGYPIRIVRDFAVNQGVHVSEGQLDSEPMRAIENNTTREGLYSRVNALIAELA